MFCCQNGGGKLKIKLMSREGVFVVYEHSLIAVVNYELLNLNYEHVIFIF